VAASDLCTVQDVRTRLQKPTSDVLQDPIIGDFITAVSKVITNYCNRQFTDGGTTSHVYSVRLNGYRRGYVDLVPYDARTVTQVRMDTDQSVPTTLTADEYRLMPKSQGGDGVYTYMLLQPFNLTGSMRWPEREVTVTGTWGFSEVPADVAEAAAETVALWMRRDVSAFTTTYNLDESRIERPEALPSAVRALLSNYKRPVI
jgi:hypothetical protein